MADYKCEECGKRERGRPQTTVIGRLVCPSCAARTTGLAAGMIAAGGATTGATPDVTAQAIATEGWFQRLRRRARGGSGTASSS